MSKQQRGLGKGLGALLGGDTDLSQIRKPVGYVNKEVVNVELALVGVHFDILRDGLAVIALHTLYEHRLTALQVGKTISQYVKMNANQSKLDFYNENPDRNRNASQRNVVAEKQEKRQSKGQSI